MVRSGTDGTEVWRHPSPVTLASDVATVDGVEIRIGLNGGSEPAVPGGASGGGSTGSVLLPETG